MQGYNLSPPGVWIPVSLIPRVASKASRYVPLSSANPIVDELARGRERFVIYNKTDLADPVANKALCQGRRVGFPQLIVW